MQRRLWLVSFFVQHSHCLVDPIGSASSDSERPPRIYFAMLMISHDLLELDDDHRNALDRAIRNMLSTKIAQVVFAQIFNGLPTKQSLLESFDHVEGHPVHEMGYKGIHPSSFDKVRTSIGRFNIFDLDFNRKAIECFQKESVGSDAFSLLLIELVVVACHEAGARAYAIDGGAYKHKTYHEWRERVLVAKGQDIESRRSHASPLAAFSHPEYQYPEQYPRGITDVAGYWVESKIFGGVVLFDRGETENKCKSMWIHSDLIKGPKTLYPPTRKQFDALVKFLTTPMESHPERPLPILGTPSNLPRRDPYDAFAYHHIFRDRFERKLDTLPHRQQDEHSDYM
ncbi:hypothetical protein FGSG_07840 [Fusarium graminearum PH-1]|uniref:Chromosome 4, complete genome n=1 Tax=Gibberella zeae (strain ATCC MYA-4620 / CBS 123657 / FGSC 9075 / NRRL 31084 / PH-1) TaxID=229533 RepID=I1RUF0_GIBZE|nr:hypothetical protein FGSG_07840 [Fusarium graminearum PH-1]ESU14158.1 hypothetical protein FGSG_07840 [Fusarium graminearum PH-1]CEF84039.1 unnamed protein product [Fusarium graminearum]|eukprot:XP_011327665.1 hypothetical protein FGSG_07840 [Fusarium graminearum PH-1]